MKKRDVIIIAVALCVALAGLAAVHFWPKGTPAFVRIHVAGAVYKELPLDRDHVETIDQGNGKINHVEIKNGVVRMLDSTCPDKLCLGFGGMSVDSADWVLGNMIVCMPNNVWLELVANGEAAS